MNESISRYRSQLVVGLVAAAAAFILAWISTGYTGITGWFPFLVLIVMAAGAGAGVFRLLRPDDPPPWLARLTVGAAILRLAAGAAWFVLLPAAGYDTEVQNAGYVMEDAFRRDTAAWELAESDAPLSAAFRETEFGNYRSADQYGGLLFLSAAVYRSFGGAEHHPLTIVVLTAGLSALAVPLGWAFTRRLFDERTAGWAAWVLALFPEAVLLGSSQMREAFLMPLAAAAFYGLVRFHDKEPGGRRAGTAWLIAPLALMLPLSPPFAGITALVIALLWLGLNDWKLLRAWPLWAVLGGLALIAVLVLWGPWWEQIAPRLNAEDFSSPVEMAAHWLELSARWQARQTAAASGWLQRIFETTPEWFDLPFLIAYGVSRPLLPAQLTAYSLPVWWGIGVWRSLGWTALLLPLLYAPIRVFRKKEGRGRLAGLTLAVWAGILIAAFWGGADQWDNPRYRVALVCLQAALAAHIVVSQLRDPDPAMRRVLVIALTVPAWFLFWYLLRYTAFDQFVGWTVIDVFKLLGAGVFSGVLLAVWDWAKD
jgi:4-amino-4-deoxy-L-arabinose transferase-like glycosyltransferase